LRLPKSSWPIADRIEWIEKTRIELGLVPDFQPWLKSITPNWTWDKKFQLHIQEYLDYVTNGEINKLVLMVPVRHGKSELVTIRYPVWRLEREPALNVIIGAYNQTLANKFSRKARRIARVRLSLSKDREAVEEWETAQGGTLRAVGVGSGVTGHGGDLIVLDDPVKNREEADSLTYRDKVWDWYTNDVYTRLEPHGAIVLIMARWHDDDLAGRILSSSDGPNWEVIRLPAEAEEDDRLERIPGEPLWPERFDMAALADRRTVLGRDYFALYQQRPQPREGEMFKRAWFDIVESAPANAQRVRYWDKAGTAGAGAFTAGVLMASSNGHFYIEDVVRGQWAAAEREPIIRQTAILDAGRGQSEVWVEQEPGSGGKESAEATIRNLAGFVVFADRVTGKKELRAEPLAAQAQAGNVKLMRGPWNAGFLDEITNFPSGQRRDQVDAASGAFNKLAVFSELEVY
jgi:predicted phage terminase large subunit-like protein